MKLRYQMRGLGIGIIVTALLMGVIKGEKVPLSDAEIKALASELGMVESDSLRLSDFSNMSSSQEGQQMSGAEAGDPKESDSVPEGDAGKVGDEDSGSEEASGPDSGQEEEMEGESSIEEENSGGDGLDADSVSDANQEQTKEPVADGNLVTVVVDEGVTSYSVCQLLEELGLVEDADSLDYYICSNSYSRSIQEGTYQIPMGTGEEEIVRILMGNKGAESE